MLQTFRQTFLTSVVFIGCKNRRRKCCISPGLNICQFVVLCIEQQQGIMSIRRKESIFYWFLLDGAKPDHTLDNTTKYNENKFHLNQLNELQTGLCSATSYVRRNENTFALLRNCNCYAVTQFIMLLRNYAIYTQWIAKIYALKCIYQI